MKSISALILAAVLPLAAQAQASDTARVEVRHALDVSQACPGVFDELPSALASAWHDAATSGDVVVQFKLDGDGKHDVQTLSGIRRLASPVRWAVRNDLTCRSPDGGQYVVRFVVRFRYPGDPDYSTAAMIGDMHDDVAKR